MTACILVTGANGFIGRNLCKTLVDRNYSVRALIRKPDLFLSKILPVENIFILKDGQSFCQQSLTGEITTIVHCAALVHQMGNDRETEVLPFREVNRDNTLILAEQAISVRIKNFIFLSTVKVMGSALSGEKTSAPLPNSREVITENDEPHPDDAYGRSKYDAELGLKKLFESQDKSKCVTIRLPMVYGPGNKGNMLALLKCAERRIPLPLKGITAKRSVIYVQNLCDAVATVIADDNSDKPPFLSQYVSDGEDRSSGELYDAIFRELNGRTGVFFLPTILFQLARRSNRWLNSIISRLIDNYCFSSAAFEKTYNWKAPFSFQHGIKETVHWYRTRRIHPDDVGCADPRMENALQ